MGSVLIFSYNGERFFWKNTIYAPENAIWKSGKSGSAPRQKTHLNSYVSDFRKFAEIKGISYLIESDLSILRIEAKDWENVYQRPRKQAGETPASILETCGTYVSDSIKDLPGRLFVWSFRVAVAAALRWGDLINTAPATTVLTHDGFIGFAGKTKTMGNPEGRPWGATRYSFSNGKWLRGGFGLFLTDSGDLSRDFWIGKPLVIASVL